ncbi:PolC-type DNA polymerase III [Vibrio barjaei]|jgi:DNA polymerase-3 subunit epsilon|uniref:3'-5' exonuclease n=1 Tax=Vibrio barjaei TaxID=1676683 RepID=UPI0007BC2399|nr:3'-5' exonuclease [Vibrio barjaei]OIN24196.1 DNA polymerase III subunit epsilon [Vibrio barjaei]
MMLSSAKSVVVLDFETTGLSPNQGDRAIEIGAVKLENGTVVDRFQSLMNPGFRVSGFIENYTGISNAMLANAPSCKDVMGEFSTFIQNSNLVAHNASFDKRFLDAELELINESYTGGFACSLLVSRRLNQETHSHKLGDLVAYHNIANDGVFHRALADAEVTASLWLLLVDSLTERFQINDPSFALMQKLSKQPKASIAQFLTKQAV